MRITGDKRLLTAVATALSVILCVIALNLSLSSEKELKNLKNRQKELALLKNEYLSLKNRIDVVEGKLALTNVKGVVQAVEEVFLSLKLKQKLKSVKPVAVKEIKGAVEEEAEVQVEKTDMNEMVNIFYRIENAPMSIFIKKTNVRASFENPALLDITMTIALIRPK
ncbi:MAG: hypothetical protein HY099_05220 [Nitrospirae bacterium]|nr:hypothetical protein [Nitrospirota bacterium]